MKIFLKKWWDDLVSLLKEIPIYITIIFVITVIVMNILSNIILYQSKYLAIDGGFIVSWIVFLIMDLVVIHFGPKASIKLCFLAVVITLFGSLLFYLISLIPGTDSIKGNWFILLSSSVAFLVSGILDSLLNYLIGKFFKKNPNGKGAFICRSYISTLMGQFVDNLIFATLTFMVFAPIFWNGFSWTIVQCLTCSILFAVIEVIMEIVFSPIGYHISKVWHEKGIGNN